MNIRTELLENQTARVTVEIDPERYEQARKRAIRKVARSVRIPGFRKGKAPYHILVQSGLEPQIITETFDGMYQDVYKELMEESGLETYGPGMFEKFEQDPPSLVYIVSLPPKVDLADYQSIRKDYDPPQIDDEAVDTFMRQLQEQHALVEETTHPIEKGYRVKVDVRGTYLDDPVVGEDDDNELSAKGDVYIDTQGIDLRLDEDASPILPGFTEMLVGAKVGDDVVFELAVPDEEAYQQDAGRKIEFVVTIHQVEAVTLPALNDDFAARVTTEEGSEEEPLTMLQLRLRVRENLQFSSDQRYDEGYGESVLEDIIDGAELAFPAMMVSEQVENMIEDLKSRLKGQKMSLKRYLSILGQTEEELHENYRPMAEDAIKRMLVLREIVSLNNIEVTEAQVEKRIDQLVERFGPQAERARTMFQTPEMRVDVVNQLLNEEVFAFIVAIGKGEEPVFEVAIEEEPAEEPAEETEDVVEAGEAADEADDDDEITAEDEDVQADEETQTDETPETAD